MVRLSLKEVIDQNRAVGGADLMRPKIRRFVWLRAWIDHGWVRFLRWWRDEERDPVNRMSKGGVTPGYGPPRCGECGAPIGMCTGYHDQADELQR